MPQPLPPKENALFKSIVKHYETKQYKKGLKAADAVLKKHPEHGETLAMRGLILNCMDRKAEAYEYVKKGLSKDIRSHVCWHVFGLVHRSDRDYKEAVKCYRNALRIEPDNLQILRDLSLLQVQLRDRLGYLETRHVLLKLKPAMRLNWIGIAVANHLLGRHARAIDVLSAYENTLEGSPEPESAYERSEMALYKLELMKDAGMRTEALELLGKSEAQIVDKTAVRELRAELHLALANYSAAASEYRRLLELNAEEHGYYAGLHAAILERPLPQPTLAGRPGGKSPYGAPATRRPTFAGLAEKERSLLLTAHAELRAAHPRASAPRRLPLDIVSAHGPEGAARFDQMFSAYVLPLLRKGVPSLFADIRPLYADAAKAERIGALLQRWEGLLAEGKPLDGGAAGGDGGACGDRGSGTEVPSTLLWVRFMLAQHHDAHGRHEEALACAEACIGHTPTLLELYVFKGRVYKHAGDWAEAAKWLEHARSLDLADRYLNTKATRYLLRADRVDEAAAVIAHFTKDGTDRESNLFDMQCMWWETEAGEALRRTGQLGKALKKLLAVERHFVDIVEDQFDFHTYCLRKMTLRSYLQLLRLEEHVWGHAFFERAAFGAIGIYIELADAAKAKADADAAAASSGEQGEDEVGAAERKKAASKARKAAAKAAADATKREAEEKEAAAKADKESGVAKKKPQPKADGEKREVDDDPDGAKLAATHTPLLEASKLLSTLQVHSADVLETQLLALAVYRRRGLFLLAVRALRRALALASASEPRVHSATIDLFAAVEVALAQPQPQPHANGSAEGGAAAAAPVERALAPAVRSVLAAQREQLICVGGKAVSLRAFNDEYAATHAARCAGAAAAAAATCVQLAPASAAEAVASLVQCPLAMGACTLADAVRVHKLLASEPFSRAAPNAAADFAKRARAERFTLSAYFREATSAHL